MDVDSSAADHSNAATSNKSNISADGGGDDSHANTNASDPSSLGHQQQQQQQQQQAIQTTTTAMTVATPTTRKRAMDDQSVAALQLKIVAAIDQLASILDSIVRNGDAELDDKEEFRTRSERFKNLILEVRDGLKLAAIESERPESRTYQGTEYLERRQVVISLKSLQLVDLRLGQVHEALSGEEQPADG